MRGEDSVCTGGVDDFVGGRGGVSSRGGVGGKDPGSDDRGASGDVKDSDASKVRRIPIIDSCVTLDTISPSTGCNFGRGPGVDIEDGL